jgi:hypothetical protein
LLKEIKAMKKFILSVLVIVLFFSGDARSTKGKEFWIAYMENINLAYNGPPVFKLHVSSDVSATCTLAVPFTGYTFTFVVNPNQVYVLSLPAGNYNPFGDESIANNGVLLSSSDSVEVKAFHYRMNFSESTLILPVDEIGTEYLIAAQNDWMNNSPSEFVILATKDNTTIQITPSAVTLGTRPVGIPFTVMLQKGQMYQLQAMGDLSGTEVKSLNILQKIAVFSGARQAQFGCNMGADDHIYDQMFPVSSFGTKFHVIPFLGHVADFVKVVASQNATTFSVSSGGTYTLNKGQVQTLTVTASCEINSNAPVNVVQLATSQGCNGTPFGEAGDPGMISLVPANLKLTRAKFFTESVVKTGPVNNFLPFHRVNVVIRNGAIGNLKLDNVVVPSNSFVLVSPGSDYSYTRLLFDTLGPLQHVLTCDSGFNASIYFFAYYTFYGHHLGYTTLDVSNTLGLNHARENHPLWIYPVPAHQMLNIQSPEQICHIEVCDLFGNTILKAKGNGLNTQVLDIALLPTGVYFCIVSYGIKAEKRQVLRFLKNEKE